MTEQVPIADADWDAFKAEMEKGADFNNVDARIDYYLEQVAACVAEVKNNHAVAVERIRAIEDWELGEGLRIDRQRQYIVGQIGQLAPATVEDTVKEYGKKSRSLPHGKFGFRSKADAVTVDNPADALTFAQANHIPVKTVHSVLKSSLKDHAKRTGETEGAGWHLVQGGPQFFVTPAT